MIKQLGPSSSRWMTLSCADLKWTEIYVILSKLGGKERLDDDIEEMTYDDKCKMLNSNPVVVAKHFQLRLEKLFKDVFLSQCDPIGHILYYAVRIEFQYRGSPHAHSFIRVDKFPALTDENTNYFVKYLNMYISANLPNLVDEPELYKLFKSYQPHVHSKICRKYKNLPCRFNFGESFTDRTIVAKPLPCALEEK